MMHFDETGKYVKSSDIHNSETHVIHDHLPDNSDSMCKFKCLQYNARNPANSGGIKKDIVRCQTCEIYLTKNGVVNGYCLCCNMRVRSKTMQWKQRREEREAERKKKLNEKPEPPAYRNTYDSWIDVNGEIDESVKTLYELKDFLDTIKLQSNYQLVMLKELVEYDVNHKGEIAESLAYFNNKDTTDFNTVKYYLTVPVYDVLLNHGFVITTDTIWKHPFYKLNVNLNESQKIGILEIINSKLNEYNKLHEIPENEWPNSDNRGSIDWEDIIH
jgi:hypothetical protein